MTRYQSEQPTREEIDALRGPAVLAFGTDWCGYCVASDRYVKPVLAERPDVPLLKVEDGKGRALGRSYRVRLWPTLVFLRDGVEVSRVVRPNSRAPLEDALAGILDDAESPA